MSCCPDLFWRAGPLSAARHRRGRAGDPTQQALFAKLRASTDNERAMRDTKGLPRLAAQPAEGQVRQGGRHRLLHGRRIALRAAGTFPDRIAAAASFHGGNLATEEANSPHLLAPKMTAKLLVAGADEDRSYPEEQNVRLAAALKDARVEAAVSIWKGASTAGCPPTCRCTIRKPPSGTGRNLSRSSTRR
jgi:carboxymethylenebutenolidase